MNHRVGVAVIGPGRVGQALGKLLAQVGYPVLLVAARRLAEARRAVQFMGGGQPVPLNSLRLTEASAILLTTTDAAIRPVAESLASLPADWSGKIVLHTCGSLTAGELEPLRRRGAAVGSLHPFQTVPSPAAGVRNLVGCFWAIEGDASAQTLARRWVKALKGVAFRVRPEHKILYHISAALVCPTAITLMNYSMELLKLAGVPSRIAKPMLAQFVTETARNFVELGPRRALTGPASRGDWQTLRYHLTALRRHAPEIVPVYTPLVRAMLRVVGRRPPRGLL